MEGSKRKGSRQETHLDARLMSYYRSIADQLRQGFGDDTQKELFLSNVFQQVIAEFEQIMFNVRVSYIIQTLVAMANAEHTEAIMKVLLKNIDAVLTDQCASHVLETTLYRCSQFMNSDEDNPSVRQLHQIGMTLLERSELFTQPHSSHVVRSLIDVMAGFHASRKSAKGSHSQQSMKEHDLYGEFAELLIILSGFVLPTSAATADLIEDPHTSALAQTFLNVFLVKDPNHYNNISQTILDSGLFERLDGESLPRVMTGACSSYFCCDLVKGMPKLALGRLIKEVIVPHFAGLAEHNNANHVLQAIIENVRSEIQFKRIMKVVSGKLFYLMERRRAGVVLKIVMAALNYPEMQELVIDSFKSEMGQSSVNLITAILIGSPAHSHTDEQLSRMLLSAHYLHSMIVQQFLCFKDPQYICSCFESLSPPLKATLARSKFGSHIYNSFLNSEAVSLQAKRSLAASLKDSYGSIVTDACGSRVFEALWEIMTVPMKEEVVPRLASVSKEIFRNRYGLIVASKICLSDYIHDRNKWQKWLLETNKAKKNAVVDKKSSNVEKDVDVATGGKAGETPAKKTKKKSKKPVDATVDLPTGFEKQKAVKGRKLLATEQKVVSPTKLKKSAPGVSNESPANLKNSIPSVDNESPAKLKKCAPSADTKTKKASMKDVPAKKGKNLSIREKKVNTTSETMLEAGNAEKENGVSSPVKKLKVKGAANVKEAKKIGGSDAPKKRKKVPETDSDGARGKKMKIH